MPEEITPTTPDAGSQSTTPETATSATGESTGLEDQYEMPSDEFELPSDEAGNDDDEEDENDEATSDDQEPEENADQEDAEEGEKPTEKIIIDGVELSPEEAKEALAAFKNQREWQRAYTQRDQDFRREQKEWQTRIEQQIAQGLTKTKTDEEIAAMTPEERQTDTWLKQRGFVRMEEVQSLIDKAVSPFVEDIKTIRQNEGSRQILSEAQQLMDQFGLPEDKVLEVANFARENGMMHRPLKDSYILMNQDNIFAAQSKLKEEQSKKIAEKKKSASRGLRPNGSDGGEKPDGLDYDAKKHSKMSYRDLARSL